MIDTIVFIGLLLVSYFLGCFSTSRLIAKYFKSLNIYKVGTGHPDTQNIYYNVDKTLGIFAGLVDFGKMVLYLAVINLILRYLFQDIATQNHLLILGFVMIIGHCLPITHHFKGGRGIFTYIGFIFFFAPWPMVIVALLGLLIIIFFKQIRFAQYCIVLLPPFVNFFFTDSIEFVAKLFIAALLMGIINFVVSKKMGEI